MTAPKPATGRDPLHGLESLTVAAARVGRTPARLRQLIAADAIKGARKVGRDWYIPAGWKLSAQAKIRGK